MKRRTLIVGSVCAVAFLAVTLLAIGFLWSNSQSNIPTPPTSKTSAPVIKSTEPEGTSTELADPDIPTIKQAMADCDVEAAKSPNGLYFFVTPVMPATVETATSLVPPAGDNYGSFSLVPSQAMLGGIEDGSLTVKKSPYEFSIVDLQTKQIKKWDSAKGASRFTYPNTDGFSKFQIAFDFGDKNVKWTSEFDRQKGNCYWVNVRLQIQPSLPPYGRRNYLSKSFPATDRTLRCANRVCEIDTDP
jgi:hypothetical protein